MPVRNKAIIAAAVILIIVALLFLVRGERRFSSVRNGGERTVGERAPDFTLSDLQGRKFRLSEQRGKPVLLVFTTTWCPTCRAEIPRLKGLYERYAPRGLTMVNIDIQEPRDRVAAFTKQYGLPYRVLPDERGKVARDYGIFGVPTLVLVDKDGMIEEGRLSTEQALEGML